MTKNNNMKNKIINIIILVIGVLATLACVMFALKYDPADPGKASFYQDSSMYVTYFLFFVAALIAIGFAVVQIVSNFKQAKTGLFAVLGLVLLFGVTYLLSGPSNSVVEQKSEVTAHMAKVIGGGILSTYLLVAIVILTIVWSVIASRLKN